MKVVSPYRSAPGRPVSRRLNPFGMKILALFLLVTCAFPATFAQKENKLLRGGNRQYEDGKFKDAEMSYRKALEINKESSTGQFNLGDAIYQQKNYEEAAKVFGNLAESAEADEGMKARAYHNLGNSLLQGKKFEESIQAYKKSLIHNPKDDDTRYNLEYARRMLQKQQQQQQQNKDQQKKDQEKQDQSQDQKKQDQNQDQKKDKKDQQDQKQKISKEDAERMLEALKNDERKTLQKVKKQKAKVQTVIIEKDW